MSRSRIHMLRVLALRMEDQGAPDSLVKVLRTASDELEAREVDGRAHSPAEEKRIESQRTLFNMLPSSDATDRLRDAMMQRAYDLLWNGDALACDALDARAARAALDARDALAARAALDARDARDARAVVASALTSLQRFAAWCIQGNYWWWGWDLSLLSSTWFGARQLGKPQVEQWSRPLLDAFLAGCWCLYWTDDTLYWVAKPTLHRDPAPNTRRLHNEHYAALESDVENLYFWHGLLVPAFVVVRPDWITLKHIDGETNAEVRRVMIERYRHGEAVAGAAAYIRDAGGQRLDHDERYGTLWHREVPGDEPIVMIEVINSTREADGSFKHYWLRVPPAVRTAHEAVAWTFDVAPQDYAPLVET